MIRPLNSSVLLSYCLSLIVLCTRLLTYFEIAGTTALSSEHRLSSRLLVSSNCRAVLYL